MYFTSPSTRAIRDAMTTGLLGMINTPANQHRTPPGAAVIFDNGCFGVGYPGDDGYIAFLESRADDARRCLFAVAPDVAPAGPMTVSLERSRPMLNRIRNVGLPVALAVQNGTEHVQLPWDDFDAVFIGGDTAWKLGAEVRAVVTEARSRGKHVHMGRVNSLRRLRYAGAIGCDSADGTYLAFGPDVNLPPLLGWLRAVNDQCTLWEAS